MCIIDDAREIHSILSKEFQALWEKKVKHVKWDDLQFTGIETI